MNRSPKRFEDTKAGNGALWLMIAAGLVIAGIRFGLAAMGKMPW